MSRTMLMIWYVAMALCAFSSNGLTQSSAPALQPEKAGDHPSFVFSDIETALRRNSHVPLRLPSFLPYVDQEHPIHAIVQAAGSSGYKILLATVLPCEGQNNCSYGSLRGSTSPITLESKSGVPVNLRGKIKGKFIKSVCHAYCSEAIVQWHEGGFYYAIGIKAESKNVLMRVANSAIPIGGVPTPQPQKR